MLTRKEIEEIFDRLKVVQSVKVLEVDEEKLELCKTALALMDRVKDEENGGEDVS